MLVFIYISKKYSINVDMYKVRKHSKTNKLQKQELIDGAFH